VLQALAAAEVRRWAAACVQALDTHREAIDRINVFPVADNDTGANLLYTMRAGLDAVLRAPIDTRSTAGAALAVLARGALSGARGNSGVIVSQVLRGLAEALVGAHTVTGPRLCAALAHGAKLAWAAVAEPVHGTMLTVLDAAAGAARRGEHEGLPEVTAAAVRAATEALDQTPTQLAVLAQAGVVDAGGRGVVVLLEALQAVVRQQPAALAAVQRARAEQELAPKAALDAPMVARREAGSDQYAYEVMYLLDGGGADTLSLHAIGTLRDTLVGLGDCVSVAGDGAGLWTVHVHCNDVGAAIEAGVQAGRPRRIMVARFADAAPAEPIRFVRDRAVVVPVRGAALAELLTGEGVAVLRVDDGEQPTPYQLLEVITATGAAHVTVLPGDGDLTEIADEAAIRAVAAGQDVVVVPCASPVQVLAAVAVHDPRRRSGDDVVHMAEAAAATRRGAVAVAAQDAITWAGPCRAGDALGFADGEVTLVVPGPASLEVLDGAARGVIDRMLTGGGELVTVLLGADAPDELATGLENFLRRAHPEADLAMYRGGQTGVVLHLGLE
jgi:DAK2 domain fusion protein YloV